MSMPLVIESPEEMALWSEAARLRGERIAFVPTMGFLHLGHQSLLKEGKGLADKLVMSLVGSSRVDLQACKLEYSIVSPK